MTTRRGFLKTILALAAAPAIVRASSLMPIYVPKKEELIVPSWLEGDFTVESWLATKTNPWKHVAIVRGGHSLKYYIDGKETTYSSLKEKGLDIIQDSISGKIKESVNGKDAYFIRKEFNGLIQDLRVMQGVSKVPKSNTLITPDFGIYLA